MIYSHEFRMLAQEGHLASNSLLMGFESLAKSDHYVPGSIYSAFFNLATGLERMMKIAFILQHKVDNDLANPPDKLLRSMSHSLVKLYSATKVEGQKRGLGEGWFDEGTLHFDILMFLSEFALGSRYHNLDQLVEGKNNDDPLVRWFNIHLQIANDCISNRQRSSIAQKTRAYCEKTGLFGFQMGMRGEYELTIDIMIQRELTLATRGHCVWFILEIIQPIYQLLDQLCDGAHTTEMAKAIDPPIVPHFTEFFPFGLTTREDALRRKAWTSLFPMGGRY